MSLCCLKLLRVLLAFAFIGMIFLCILGISTFRSSSSAEDQLARLYLARLHLLHRQFFVSILVLSLGAAGLIILQMVLTKDGGAERADNKVAPSYSFGVHSSLSGKCEERGGGSECCV